MNVRNSAFLTLALLVIAAPAFGMAAAGSKDPKATVAKPGIAAQALEFGKSGVKKVTDHPVVAASVVAAAGAGVAYKFVPKFKAKVDAGATAVKASAQATYKAICAKLSALDNKQFTRADAAKGGALVLAVYGLKTYSASIKAGAVSAKTTVATKLSEAYNYCASSKAVTAVKNASNKTKAAVVAVTAVAGVAVYKAYNYFKNRKKAAPVAAPAVPTPVVASAASAQ